MNMTNSNNLGLSYFAVATHQRRHQQHQETKQQPSRRKQQTIKNREGKTTSLSMTSNQAVSPITNDLTTIETIEVDVIIPVHNASSTILETVKSALHQALPSKSLLLNEEKIFNFSYSLLL